MTTDYDELDTLIQRSTEHREAASAAKEDFARATAAKVNILEEWKRTLEQTQQWQNALQEAVAPIRQYHQDFVAIQDAFASVTRSVAPVVSLSKELQKVQASFGEMQRRIAAATSSVHQPLLRQAEDIQRIQEQLNAVLERARQLSVEEAENVPDEGESNGV